MELLEANQLIIRKQGGFFGTIPPVMAIIRGTDAQASANFTTPFFIADRPYEALIVTERHEVAATDGSVDVRKAPSGTAPSSGTSILNSAMNLTTIANTNQTATLSGTLSNRRLDKGDSLVLVATGLLTSLQGETVSVLLKAI